jgi:hypothetical protein
MDIFEYVLWYIHIHECTSFTTTTVMDATTGYYLNKRKRKANISRI